MPKKIRKKHKSPQCRGLLGVKNTELWTERCPFPSEMKGWPWVPGMRDNSDPPSPHVLPNLLEARDAWDFSRETQEQVRKKPPLPFLDYRANMQTPQTKVPQKETPQAHTPQRTMMDLPEAHAADGDEPVQHESHSTAPRAWATFQSAISHKWIAAAWNNQVLAIHFQKEFKNRISSSLSSTFRVYMNYVLCV